MVNVLRRWSQPLMVIIATLVIVSFAFWMPGGFNERKGGDVRYEIYGRIVTNEHFLKEMQRLKIFQVLDQEFFYSLGAMDEEGASVAMMVFEHEADAMGIGSTEQEELDVLKSARIFSENGQFNALMYDRFVENFMQPQGFSKDQIGSFLRPIVRMRKLKEVLGSTVAVQPSEVRDTLVERKQVTEASYVFFNKVDHIAGVAVSDEDVKKRYEEQKEALKHPEKRKVRFVHFKVPPPADPAKPPTPQEKVKALTKALQDAYDFNQALKKSGKSFDEMAAEMKLTIGQTEPFENESAPAVLDASDEASAAAFALTAEKPISAHIRTENGAFVLQLPADGITAPVQKTFEETKSELTLKIKDERAEGIARTKGEEAQKKIAEALKAGKNFTEACAAAGVTAVAHPAYSQEKPAQPPGQYGPQINEAAGKLAPGEISEYIAVKGPEGFINGGIIVHLDHRPVVDESGFAAEAEQTKNRLARMRTHTYFSEWLRERRAVAGLKMQGASTEL